MLKHHKAAWCSEYTDGWGDTRSYPCMPGCECAGKCHQISHPNCIQILFPSLTLPINTCTTSVWTVLTRERARLSVRKDHLPAMNPTSVFRPCEVFWLFIMFHCNKKIHKSVRIYNIVVSLIYHHDFFFILEFVRHVGRKRERISCWCISI